jgi:hypothetical protein
MDIPCKVPLHGQSDRRNRSDGRKKYCSLTLKIDVFSFSVRGSTPCSLSSLALEGFGNAKKKSRTKKALRVYEIKKMAALSPFFNFNPKKNHTPLQWRTDTEHTAVEEVNV